MGKSIVYFATLFSLLFLSCNYDTASRTVMIEIQEYARNLYKDGNIQEDEYEELLHYINKKSKEVNFNFQQQRCLDFLKEEADPQTTSERLDLAIKSVGKEWCTKEDVEPTLDDL